MRVVKEETWVWNNNKEISMMKEKKCFVFYIYFWKKILLLQLPLICISNNYVTVHSVS